MITNQEEKNIASGPINEIYIEKGFFVLLFKNETNTTQIYERDVDNKYIQFHFCLKGSSRFNYNNNSYSFDVLDSKNILLYNKLSSYRKPAPHLNTELTQKVRVKPSVIKNIQQRFL